MGGILLWGFRTFDRGGAGSEYGVTLLGGDLDDGNQLSDNAPLGSESFRSPTCHFGSGLWAELCFGRGPSFSTWRPNGPNHDERT